MMKPAPNPKSTAGGEQTASEFAAERERVNDAEASEAVMVRLKNATEAEHKALEALEFNRRLATGNITRREYAALIHVHIEIHRGLEPALSSHLDERVRSIWRDDQSKLELLEADLAQHPLATDPLDAGISRARDFGQCVGHRAAAEPLWLLGVLYVVEGSTLGGMFLRPRIAQSLGCKPDELHYYGAYGTDTKRRWVAFGERMNGAIDTDESIAQCVQGANEAFTAYQRVFRAFDSAQHHSG